MIMQFVPYKLHRVVTTVFIDSNIAFSIFVSFDFRFIIIF